MKRTFAGLVVVALVVFTGCNGAGTPGGPGATDTNAKPPLYGQADNTFELSVPSSLPLRSTTLKQGETTKVLIGIKRGKNFDQDVTLSFEGLPSGVTVDPVSPVIKAGETEANLVLTTAGDASLGDFTVKVKGHPTKGSDAMSEFKVAVVKSQTFTLSGPILSTSLKQGETKAVSMNIKRDKDFTEDVTLNFSEMPKGVTIEPASPVIKSGDTEAKIMVKATDDAALGDFTITVKGHPTKGADAMSELKLTVNKK